MTKQTDTSSRQARNRPPFECIALVLQGGGALGAYQAGVFEALTEAGVEPDWISGISIGAFNSAIIAGNPPEARVDRLRQFWEAVTEPFVEWHASLRVAGRGGCKQPLRMRRGEPTFGNSPSNSRRH